MTDEQIVQFILHRATTCDAKMINPKLVVIKNMNSLILGIKASNYNDVFMLRFLNNNKRSLFAIRPNHPKFNEWKNSLVEQHGNTFMIDYDLNAIPSYVKHYVSYAFISALNTPSLGFDIFSISYLNDPMIIRPNDTYEMAAIEIDLMCL